MNTKLKKFFAGVTFCSMIFSNVSALAAASYVTIDFEKEEATIFLGDEDKGADGYVIEWPANSFHPAATAGLLGSEAKTTIKLTDMLDDARYGDGSAVPTAPIKVKKVTITDAQTCTGNDSCPIEAHIKTCSASTAGSCPVYEAIANSGSDNAAKIAGLGSISFNSATYAVAGISRVDDLAANQVAHSSTVACQQIGSLNNSGENNATIASLGSNASADGYHVISTDNTQPSNSETDITLKYTSADGDTHAAADIPERGTITASDFVEIDYVNDAIKVKADQVAYISATSPVMAEKLYKAGDDPISIVSGSKRTLIDLVGKDILVRASATPSSAGVPGKFASKAAAFTVPTRAPAPSLGAVIITSNYDTGDTNGIIDLNTELMEIAPGGEGVENPAPSFQVSWDKKNPTKWENVNHSAPPAQAPGAPAPQFAGTDTVPEPVNLTTIIDKKQVFFVRSIGGDTAYDNAPALNSEPLQIKFERPKAPKVKEVITATYFADPINTLVTDTKVGELIATVKEPLEMIAWDSKGKKPVAGAASIALFASGDTNPAAKDIKTDASGDTAASPGVNYSVKLSANDTVPASKAAILKIPALGKVSKVSWDYKKNTLKGAKANAVAYSIGGTVDNGTDEAAAIAAGPSSWNLFTTAEAHPTAIIENITLSYDPDEDTNKGRVVFFRTVDAKNKKPVGTIQPVFIPVQAPIPTFGGVNPANPDNTKVNIDYLKEVMTVPSANAFAYRVSPSPGAKEAKFKAIKTTAAPLKAFLPKGDSAVDYEIAQLGVADANVQSSPLVIAIKPRVTNPAVTAMVWYNYAAKKFEKTNGYTGTILYQEKGDKEWKVFPSELAVTAAPAFKAGYTAGETTPPYTASITADQAGQAAAAKALKFKFEKPGEAPKLKDVVNDNTGVITFANAETLLQWATSNSKNDADWKPVTTSDLQLAADGTKRFFRFGPTATAPASKSVAVSWKAPASSPSASPTTSPAAPIVQ